MSGLFSIHQTQYTSMKNILKREILYYMPAKCIIWRGCTPDNIGPIHITPPKERGLAAAIRILFGSANQGILEPHTNIYNTPRGLVGFLSDGKNPLLEIPNVEKCYGFELLNVIGSYAVWVKPVYTDDMNGYLTFRDKMQDIIDDTANFLADPSKIMQIAYNKHPRLLCLHTSQTHCNVKEF